MRFPILRYAHKKADPRFLAEALNLLLKPPQLPEIHQPTETFPQATPQARYSNYLNNLVSSLLAPARDAQLLEMAPHELLDYVKRVQDQSRLHHVVELLAGNEKLSPQLLTDIVLNPHFSTPQSVPVVMDTRNHIDHWTPLQHSQFDIVMLKKWDDVSKPLSIIKNLKLNFSNYLELIKRNQLSPFFERIVWKYVFEYIRYEDELEYVATLNLRLSFLILEVLAPEMIPQLAVAISSKFNLNPCQKLFLKTAELVPSHDIKRISIKYRPWQTQLAKHRQVLLIQAMETQVMNQLINSVDGDLDDHHRQLVKLVGEIKVLRTQPSIEDPGYLKYTTS